MHFFCLRRVNFQNSSILNPPNDCPGYDTKQSDGEVPAMLELMGNMEYPFIAIAPRSTLARSGSTW